MQLMLSLMSPPLVKVGRNETSLYVVVVKLRFSLGVSNLLEVEGFSISVSLVYSSLLQLTIVVVKAKANAMYLNLLLNISFSICSI